MQNLPYLKNSKCPLVKQYTLRQNLHTLTDLLSVQVRQKQPQNQSHVSQLWSSYHCLIQLWGVYTYQSKWSTVVPMGQGFTLHFYGTSVFSDVMSEFLILLKRFCYSGSCFGLEVKIYIQWFTMQGSSSSLFLLIYWFIYFCGIQLLEEIPYIRKKELLKNWRIMYLILCHLNNIIIMWFLLYPRRKQVGVLACEHWNNQYPKFNTPERKAALAKFAEQIAPECAVPAAGFNKDGIAKHIQDFYNEQRRYQKRKLVGYYTSFQSINWQIEFVYDGTNTFVCD